MCNLYVFLWSADGLRVTDMMKRKSVCNYVDKGHLFYLYMDKGQRCVLKLARDMLDNKQVWSKVVICPS